MVNGRCPGGDYIHPVETLQAQIVSFWMQSMFKKVFNGTGFHIGVGSNVVCSTTIGNARASTRGIDNRTIPRFFLCQIVANLMQDIETI